MSGSNARKLSPNTVHVGDNLLLFPALPAASVDAIVTDPPYGIGFGSASWDSFSKYADKGKTDASPAEAVGYQAWCRGWAAEVLRVLKPGAYLLAFGATRRYHRLATALEEAGFLIRDTLVWGYSSGFPVGNREMGAALDAHLGVTRPVVGHVVQGPVGYTRKASRGNTKPTLGNCYPVTRPASALARHWHGYGTRLKPAWEPIVLAQKPLDGQYAANVAAHGVGGLNIDGCRVPYVDAADKARNARPRVQWIGRPIPMSADKGRFPANQVWTDPLDPEYARFFLVPKASLKDRGPGNDHPTVKPTVLMEYLIRLVTQPGHLVLDPFCGSGSTLVACVRQERAFVGFEQDSKFAGTARKRVAVESSLTRRAGRSAEGRRS